MFRPNLRFVFEKKRNGFIVSYIKVVELMLNTLLWLTKQSKQYCAMRYFTLPFSWIVLHVCLCLFIGARNTRTITQRRMGTIARAPLSQSERSGLGQSLTRGEVNGTNRSYTFTWLVPTDHVWFIYVATQLNMFERLRASFKSIIDVS